MVVKGSGLKFQATLGISQLKSEVTKSIPAVRYFFLSSWFHFRCSPCNPPCQLSFFSVKTEALVGGRGS